MDAFSQANAARAASSSSQALGKNCSRGVVSRFNGFDLKVIKVGFCGDDVVISGDMFIECLFFFEDR